MKRTLLLLVLAVALAGCGDTTIDSSRATPPTAQLQVAHDDARKVNSKYDGWRNR